MKLFFGALLFTAVVMAWGMLAFMLITNNFEFVWVQVTFGMWMLVGPIVAIMAVADNK